MCEMGYTENCENVKENIVEKMHKKTTLADVTEVLLAEVFIYWLALKDVVKLTTSTSLENKSVIVCHFFAITSSSYFVIEINTYCYMKWMAQFNVKSKELHFNCHWCSKVISDLGPIHPTNNEYLEKEFLQILFNSNEFLEKLVVDDQYLRCENINSLDVLKLKEKYIYYDFKRLIHLEIGLEIQEIMDWLIENCYKLKFLCMLDVFYRVIKQNDVNGFVQKNKFLNILVVRDRHNWFDRTFKEHYTRSFDINDYFSVNITFVKLLMSSCRHLHTIKLQLVDSREYDVVALQQLIQKHQPLTELIMRHKDAFFDSLHYTVRHNGQKRLHVKISDGDRYFKMHRTNTWCFFFILFGARNDFNEVQFDYTCNMTENELLQLIHLIKTSKSLCSLNISESLPGEYSVDDLIEGNIDCNAMLMHQKTCRTAQNYFDDIIAACNPDVECFIRFADHSMLSKSSWT